MLELKIYTTQELCEALNIKPTSFKTHKEKFLKDYDYNEVKTGRSKSYQILSYNVQEKSHFIQLCEQIAKKEVRFPKEETAEKLLKVLFHDDYTIDILEEIGEQIHGGIERHTISKYIKLFREYRLLPQQMDKIEYLSYDDETGELFSKYIDPNKYTYYKVFNRLGVREEVTRDEYFTMQNFIRSKYEEYLFEQLEMIEGLDKETKKDAIKVSKEYANSAAYNDCIKLYDGVPRKAFAKTLTKQAYKLFSQYFKKDDAA